jgi:Protein of unknown function (DUF1360)
VSVPLILVLSALAAFRAARLITADSLIEGWRTKLEAWAYDDAGQYRHVGWVPSARVDRMLFVFLPHDPERLTLAVTFIRGKLADLLTCPFCLGVWFSAACVLGSWWAGWLPGGLISILFIAAVAGGQSLLASIDSALSEVKE